MPSRELHAPPRHGTDELRGLDSMIRIQYFPPDYSMTKYGIITVKTLQAGFLLFEKIFVNLERILLLIGRYAALTRSSLIC